VFLAARYRSGLLAAVSDDARWDPGCDSTQGLGLRNFQQAVGLSFLEAEP
jgi:hypothetical protein